MALDIVALLLSALAGFANGYVGLIQQASVAVSILSFVVGLFFLVSALDKLAHHRNIVPA